MKTLKLLIVAATAAVFFSAPIQPAQADGLGVVLMHGKWGMSSPKSPIGKLASALDDAGFLVVTPEMPWSGDRLYDKDFQGAMAEIDEAVAELKSKGAAKIVVGGHSFGSNAGLAYGARREGLAGILAIAPGHVPDAPRWRDHFAPSVAKAREMIAAGKGDDTLEFVDMNQGRKKTLERKAKVIASWFDPEGDAVMPLNAAKLKPNTPLMWIIGEDDGLSKRGPGYAFDKAPANPKSLYKVVGGGHGATPNIGKDDIIAWLKTL
jgi:pimeloyl-ACP methyl ester carboxylesterase